LLNLKFSFEGTDNDVRPVGYTKGDKYTKDLSDSSEEGFTIFEKPDDEYDSVTGEVLARDPETGEIVYA